MFDNIRFLASVTRMVGNLPLCCESALSVLGYSTCINYVPVYLNSEMTLDAQCILLMKEDMDYQDVVTLDNGYRVTTIERTICDMIRWDRQEEFTYQALVDYYFEFEDLTKLYKAADKYGVRQQIDDYIEEISNETEFY